MRVSYRTIARVSEGIYKEKGSKFLAYAHPVSSIEEAKALNKWYRKEFFDARHHCFAYVINPLEEQTRAADDGEPNNSAGVPILGQIKSFELCNVMVMIVRYFGGTKLGVSGLVTAYKTAAHDALLSANIIEVEIKEKINLHFDYQEMEKIMRVIKNYDLQISEQRMSLSCDFTLEVPMSKMHEVRHELEAFLN